MEIADLIQKLEAADEGSRELDAAIARCFSHDVESEDGDFFWGPFDETPVRVPDFSTRIESAISLKPEGANCHGYDYTANLGVEAYFSRNRVKEGHWLTEAFHKSSIPLALCIAGLRACFPARPNPQHTVGE